MTKPKIEEIEIHVLIIEAKWPKADVRRRHIIEAAERWLAALKCGEAFEDQELHAEQTRVCTVQRRRRIRHGVSGT